MSDLAAPSAFELARRAPSQRTAGLISGMTGYRETARGRFSQRETASLVVPLIISFGTPFLIALGREPDAADRQPSFAAGLYAGPVLIESDGGAECVQVDFTPLGAYRFFGGAVVDLAARMVDIGDVLGREGRQLRERLGATSGWQNRFDLVEDFVADRANHLPSPEIEFAYRRLARTAGGARITALAKEIGWSRKHLVEPFSIRTRSRAEAGCPHHALPSCLPARTYGRSAAAGPGLRPRAVMPIRRISPANFQPLPAKRQRPGPAGWR